MGALGCSGDLLSKYISVSETQTPVPGAGIRCTWVHSAIVFQLIIYLQKHFFIARKLHFSFSWMSENLILLKMGKNTAPSWSGNEDGEAALQVPAPGHRVTWPGHCRHRKLEMLKCCSSPEMGGWRVMGQQTICKTLCKIDPNSF